MVGNSLDHPLGACAKAQPQGPMTLDWRTLGWAVLIEAALAGLAMFGGPHGELGRLPWVLQLPGILLVLVLPGESYFIARVTAMLAIQVAVWYTGLAALRRFRARRVKRAA